MKSDVLFISDLHLSVLRPDLTQKLLAFLEQRTRTAERLYVLGDLFDAYIGDDDDARPNREVKQALRRLSDKGTAIFFQHGNRDFLVGERFCRETGASLLDDYAVIDLFGQKALVTHGDLLCSDDIAYQEARLRVRADAWKRQALSKPLWLRQLYARWYRFKSGIDKSRKTQSIMDVNPETVAETMRRFDVRLLIHGHTHRPGQHHLSIDGTDALRLVLPQWDRAGYAIRFTAKGQWAEETIV